MHIVCTDESSDGTLERAPVEAAGLTFHHRPCRTPAQFAAASDDADALLVGLLPVPGDLLRLRPQLKLIVACSTGFDHIDLAAADALGILVCNAGDYCSDEVADHTLTLLLAAWRKLLPLCAEVRSGGWNFDAAGPPRPMQGATLGLIGVGRIGSRVAGRARAFGLRVIGCDPLIPVEQLVHRGVEPVPLSQLLTEADIISLHLPSQPDRQPVLDQAAFDQMRPGALLIDVSRMDLIDLRAARAALASGRLSALALDVWETEPPVAPDSLFDHPHVLITPHAAWYSTHSVRALHERTAEEAVRILSGQPRAFWSISRGRGD